jgi:uncharacterized protein
MIILFYVLAFLAEVLGTLSGFGSSILFVPLASYFFDFKSVLGITALFHVFSNISKILLFRKGIDKTISIWLGIPAVLFVIVGAYLSKIIPVKNLELLLSIVMIGFSFMLILFNKKPIGATKKNLIIGGTASGFLAGLLGTGGAIRGVTLASFQLEKNLFIGTSAMIDFGVDFSRMLVYLINGFMKKEFLFMIPFLILISILGSYTGKRILEYIPNELFQKIVLVVIIVISIINLITFFVK